MKQHISLVYYLIVMRINQLQFLEMNFQNSFLTFVRRKWTQASGYGVLFDNGTRPQKETKCRTIWMQNVNLRGGSALVVSVLAQNPEGHRFKSQFNMEIQIIHLLHTR